MKAEPRLIFNLQRVKAIHLSVRASIRSVHGFDAAPPYRNGGRCIITFICLLLLLTALGCNAPFSREDDEMVTFGVIDVGQGLSQIIRQGDRAILFDAGTEDPVKSWRNAYRLLGNPRIEAVVISHRDLDHTGGLQFLDQTVDWSGRLVTGKWEDTAFIRSCCSKWNRKIYISTVTQEDSIYFTGNCSISCLWPPASPPDSIPIPDLYTNNYSLVFSVRYLNTAVLLTGDIDSAAAWNISQKYLSLLRADIVVVPHHGSASSVCPLFYGYIRPGDAIISYSENNNYGHPAPATTDMLVRQGITCLTTASDGTFFRKTAGFYWEPGY